MAETNDQVRTIVPVEAHYRAKSASGWSAEMTNTWPVDINIDIDHAGVLGEVMTGLTLEGLGIKKARVQCVRGGWQPYQTGYDTDKPLGNGSNIVGIEIVGHGYQYSVHAKGGSWLPIMTVSPNEGESMALAGSGIDAIWISKI